MCRWGILLTHQTKTFYFTTRWRDVVAVRRQLKRQMRGFPAAPCCVDPQFKLKALAPSAPAQPSMVDLARGLANLGNAGTLSLSSTRSAPSVLWVLQCLHWNRTACFNKMCCVSYRSLKMRREVVHQMRVHYYYQRLLEWVTSVLTQSVLRVTGQRFDLFLVLLSVTKCGRHSICQLWWLKTHPIYSTEFSGKLFSSCRATTTTRQAWQTGKELHLLFMSLGDRQVGLGHH